jgi:F0F1-type ATP synthase membrane subunit b/b'
MYLFFRHQAELDEAKRRAIQELEEIKKEAKRQLGCQRMNYEEQLKQMGITLVSGNFDITNKIT